MTDFVLLYDKLRDGQIGKAEEVTSKSELADWIETYQGGKHPHAVAAVAEYEEAALACRCDRVSEDRGCGDGGIDWRQRRKSR